MKHAYVGYHYENNNKSTSLQNVGTAADSREIRFSLSDDDFNELLRNKDPANTIKPTRNATMGKSLI